MTSRAAVVALGWLALSGSMVAQFGGLISDHRRAGARLARCLGGSSRAIFRDTEPHAAVNPRDRRHLVTAWQSSGPGGGAIQAAASLDAGVTWSAPKVLPVTRCGGGPAGARRASDSWVAFGADGRVHVAAIGWRPGPDDGPDSYNALVVTSSSDGGRTWGRAALVAVGDPAAGTSHDNVAIASDPRQPARLYLTTTRYSRSPGPDGRLSSIGAIGFSSSGDGGRTWRPMVAIGPSPLGGRVSAPQPVVDPRDGVVRVFYHRTEGPRQLIGMLASIDGGSNWGPEVVVTPVVPGPYRTTNPRDGEPFVYAVDIVQVAQDPSDGTLYLGYVDARRHSAKTNGVSLVVSTDGGRSWGAPVDVSGPSVRQAWLPGVAVGAPGEVAVGYLTSDFAQGGAASLEYRRASFRLGSGLPVAVGDTLLDQGPLIWPGDYHALVATTAGYRLITGRAPPRAEPTNPTDIVVR